MSCICDIHRKITPISFVRPSATSIPLPGPQSTIHNPQSSIQTRLAGSRLLRILRYPDFRLLWLGGFLSFTGSWVQNVAQGYYVYNRYHDERLLAQVTFLWSLAVLIFGLVAGSFTDHFNKRPVLIWTQVFFACTAMFLAVATWRGFVEYWHIALIAFLNGTVSSIEMPTRQSIVSRVVPLEELPAAVPINAMTFNVARIVGPAIGGVLLALVGVAVCYVVNAISFAALVWAGWAIKSDLRSAETERGPIKDLIFEGALYTFRDPRLRTLLILEAMTAMIGLAYLPLLPAYVQGVLNIGEPRAEAAKHVLATSYSIVGIGALAGLLIMIRLADSKRKGDMVRFSICAMGVGLLALSQIREPLLAYPIFALLGMAAMMQLNTTNALFQIMSPERLRGRVLAMHVWAINGLSPFGVLFFGWLASYTKNFKHTPWWMPTTGVPLAMEYAGGLMLLGTIAALLARRGLSNLVPYGEPLESGGVQGGSPV